MKRGDLVLVAIPGDYGKPRPALVVQSNLFNNTHASITIAPVTSTIMDTPLFRITVEPSSRNGLRSVSQIMVDKITTVRWKRLGQTIGCLEDNVMLRVSRAMALWFGMVA